MPPRKTRAPISVMLVDDHSVIRERYQRLLAGSPRVKVVGGAATVPEPPPIDPDVIVLDISLPGMSGIETLKRIVDRRPAARVLLYSTYEDALYVSLAFDAGAHGYLSKSSPPELLVRAIEAVADGKRYMSPDVTQAMTQQPAKTHEVANTLSTREHEVLRLLTHGYGLTEIAERLGVSAKTVANHQSSIKQKLGAGSALQLILIAREMGLS